MRVETVSDQEEPLYADHKKVYPAAVQGKFRSIKWLILVVCLLFYYFLPFLRWDRGPGYPNQAILIDFPARRFYFFFIEIWPQEVYYLTGLLILAALTLFLMNAVAGRIWCGYLCPQTVWTDLFLAVERIVEGDRRERIIRDATPITVDKIIRKSLKHFLWIMIAWWTGGAWVLYFSDAPTLVHDLFFFEAPFIAYVWIGILTATTYVLAGFAREQVCIYMCPWPRIQAALIDEWALNVSYRVDRGEPRASLKSANKLKALGEPAGDCIDCNQCVVVCPTGTDIRLGPQLSCIQCGLCIDACDTVMTKVDRPTGLIAYDTDINIARRKEGKSEVYRLIRPRTILYAGIIVLVGAIMLTTLASRATLGLNALHDRNPIFVMNSDGSVRNGYTIRVLNKARDTRDFRLAVEGVGPNARLDVVGETHRAAGALVIRVEPDQTREFRVSLTAPPSREREHSTPIRFILTDEASGETAAVADFFKAPEAEHAGEKPHKD